MPLRRAHDRRGAQLPSTPGSTQRTSRSSSITAKRRSSSPTASSPRRCGPRSPSRRSGRVVIDVNDPEYTGPGDLLGTLDYEALLAEGDPEFAWSLPGGRVGRDRAQLHRGHHRRSQGRRLPSPRRLHRRARQQRGLGHAAPPGVSVDVADVPLQRVVLPLGARRGGSHEHLPPEGRGGRDLRPDPPASRSPISAARRSFTTPCSTHPRHCEPESTTR